MIAIGERDLRRSQRVERYWHRCGHRSFIIILLAFVISSRWGISEDLAVPVGGEVAVGHDTGLTVYAKSFTDSYTEEGQAADYVSELELRRDGEAVAEQTVRVNNPLEYEGFRIAASSHLVWQRM